ncbi:MAG TPA: DUF2461 family protein [Streptosporangiaceae bacterium]|jgi:hypothetical protein|nr:DUF2461 family protein [Streptosporangiaceae bacterium]
MRTRFHGWPEQAYVVLAKLDGEPTRETREGLRRDRERQVRQPMIDLFNDLADADAWYEDFAVWRYASTAFWWQNQCGIMRVARNIEIGFRFNLDALRVAAWWRYGNSQQIALFRSAVAAGHSGRALERLLESLAADGHEIGGDVMKRVPRGYPADHPRADLLRHRSLIVACEFEPEAVLDVEPVYRACERLRPLLGWLAEHTAVAPDGSNAAPDPISSG